MIEKKDIHCKEELKNKINYDKITGEYDFDY